MAAAGGSGNRRGPSMNIAPYSQHLGDFFTGWSSVLVKGLEPIYSRAWGWQALPGAKSRESLF